MVSGFSGAWQGDDSIEAPDARRLLQTVTRSETFSRKLAAKDRVNGICLRGVKRNAGRPGAAAARTRCVKRWRIWLATVDMNGCGRYWAASPDI